MRRERRDQLSVGWYAPVRSTSCEAGIWTYREAWTDVDGAGPVLLCRRATPMPARRPTNSATPLMMIFRRRWCDSAYAESVDSSQCGREERVS